MSTMGMKEPGGGERKGVPQGHGPSASLQEGTKSQAASVMPLQAQQPQLASRSVGQCGCC